MTMEFFAETSPCLGGNVVGGGKHVRGMIYCSDLRMFDLDEKLSLILLVVVQTNVSTLPNTFVRTQNRAA